MKKLRLEKITLSELSLDEQNNIKGGTHPTTTTISIASLILCSTIATIASKHDATCLTNKPGTQDSCGLCTLPPPAPGQAQLTNQPQINHYLNSDAVMLHFVE
jgi:hypothetical protein